MASSRIISMQTLTDGKRYVQRAFFMITCEDCTQSLVDSLREISEIKEVQPTCGNYDVIVKIETDSADSLRDVIYSKIRKIDKIRSTTTLVSSPILVY